MANDALVLGAAMRERMEGWAAGRATADEGLFWERTRIRERELLEA
jgi:hypothetical protein